MYIIRVYNNIISVCLLYLFIKLRVFKTLTQSSHIITNHGVQNIPESSKNIRNWFHGNGFNIRFTTIRKKRQRKIKYNQVEGWDP